MELTGAIQEALLALLCYDDSPRGAKFVSALIPPKTFDVYYADLAAAAVRYLEKYGKPPGEHTLDLVENLKRKRPDDAEIFDRLYHSMESTREGVNREYVIKQATLFARKQRLKSGISKAIETLEEDTEESIDAASSLLRKSTEDAFDLFDPGTFLHDTSRALAFLDEELDAFPTGIKEIDERGLGPARGRLWVLSALYGKGKSWMMAHLAKYALMNRLRVLYVTLELSEAEVAQRMVQTCFAVGKRQVPLQRIKFNHDDLGRWIDMKTIELKARPYLQQPDIRRYLRGRLLDLQAHKPPLLIRRFPTSMLTLRQLEGYLDGLQGAQGFMPDLMIVDMPSLMTLDPKNVTQEISATVKGLRGMAIDRNMAVAMPVQSNRMGEGARVLGGRHVAGDFSILGTADVYITYNQTDEEHELGLARLYVQKGRTDQDRFTLLISQCYPIGQFCMESTLMHNSSAYWAQVKEESPDAAEEEV